MQSTVFVAVTFQSLGTPQVWFDADVVVKNTNVCAAYTGVANNNAIAALSRKAIVSKHVVALLRAFTVPYFHFLATLCLCVPGGRMVAAKGHKPESRGLEKDGRTKRCSVVDDGTRAEHNARIVQANARREAPAAGASAPHHGLPQRLERDNAPGRDAFTAPTCLDLAHIRDGTGARARPSLPENARVPCDPRPSPWRAIGERYLALCRDPACDLVAWANETFESAASHRPLATGGEQGGLPPPRTPRTVADALVEDYLALCSDPGQDLLGWVDETVEAHGVHSPAAGREPASSQAQPRQTPSTRVAHGAASAASAIAVRTMIDDSRAVCRNPPGDPGWFLETWTRETANNPRATLKPRSDDARNRFRLRENALRPVQIRLEPGYGRRSRIHDLSPRPAARFPKHDAVQSLQSGARRPDGLAAVFPAAPARRPARYAAPDETPGRRGPEEGFDDGEQALRMLQLCFAELSRLVRRQLAHAAATAPRDHLALIRRFILEERDRHAAFLIKEFRENRANAMKRNREKARGPREPLRPQTTAPPGLMAAQRAAKEPGQGLTAAPS